MKKIITIFSLNLILSLLFPPSNVHATSLGLSIKPAVVQITIKPGKTITQAFTIQNLSDTEKEFTARLIPFSTGNLKGQPILKPNQKPDWLQFFSLANADIFLNQSFKVKPQSSRQIIMNISVPATATETDHYLTLLVTAYKTTPEAANTTVSGSIGSNLLITVSNSENPPTRIDITEFKTKESALLKIKNDLLIFDNLNPVNFSITAKNSSKFLSQVRGFFKITNARNQPQKLQSILPIYILGNSERELIASNSGQFTFSPKITDIGQYNAIINLNTDTATISSQIKLLFLPLKTTLALILALIILLSLSKISAKPT